MRDMAYNSLSKNPVVPAQLGNWQSAGESGAHSGPMANRQATRRNKAAPSALSRLPLPALADSGKPRRQ
ncbi:hypothetical protein [Croceicoccus sp. Ery15]|jgi:hypothetical protein|uniref:hypothetical protein n=1 Tax=Croceicoccus sp. Ery15 TaxID=1703338 RepID=UPI001E5A6DB6|nr:hypothetical protein [Croceicoccus sp. Ery15]